MTTRKRAAAKRAALYTRLSVGDEDLEKGRGRQLIDHLRPLATKLGYTVVAELGEKDRSASRYATRERKQYKELMAMVDAGQVDAVLFYDIDRLLRLPKELEELIDRVERTGLEVRSVTGEMDLSTASGRLIARVLVAVAAAEVDATSRRVKDHWRKWRNLGLPHTNATFGWIDFETEQPDEAYWVRFMVDEILAGDSLTGVAAKLNDKMIPRRSSILPWDATAVKSVVTTPRNYGLLRDGKTVKPGKFTGLVDAALWGDVAHALARRAVRESRPRRALLLAGVLRCAVCDQPLTSQIINGGRRVLQCRKMPKSPRCGAGNIDYQTVEDAIVDYTFHQIDNGKLAELVKPKARVDAAAVQRRLDTLAAKEAKVNRAWLDEVVSDDAHDDALRQIKTERDELTAQLAASSQLSILTEYIGKPGVLAKAWAIPQGERGHLTLDARRQIIVETLALRKRRIVVDPPTACSGHFDADRHGERELNRLHWAPAKAN